MVAITIIGILTAGSTIAFSNARARARDAQRYAVLAQMELALETYRQVNGSYPNTNREWRGLCPGRGGAGVTGPTGYVPDIAPTYIAKLPTDPAGLTNCSLYPDGYGYEYLSDGVDYKFFVHNSMDNKEKCDGATKIYWDPHPLRQTQKTCVIYSQGASGW